MKRQLQKMKSKSLVLDSAATASVVNSASMVKNLRDANGKVIITADGNHTQVAVMGDLRIKKSGGVNMPITLTDTLVVPSAPVNLISLQQLLDTKRVSVVFNYDQAVVSLIGTGTGGHSRSHCACSSNVDQLQPTVMVFKRNGRLFEIAEDQYQLATTE
jgi:hypothetical protein